MIQESNRMGDLVYDHASQHLIRDNCHDVIGTFGISRISMKMHILLQKHTSQTIYQVRPRIDFSFINKTITHWQGPGLGAGPLPNGPGLQ